MMRLLVVEGLSIGSTAVTVTTDSNGHLTTTSFTVEVHAQPGDVDMDGNVNMDDLTGLINIMLGSVLNIYDMGAADVNENGAVGMDDLTELINVLLMN